jgi:hypothetical protein
MAIENKSEKRMKQMKVQKIRRTAAALFTAAAALLTMTSCGNKTSVSSAAASSAVSAAENSPLTFDRSKWNYDSTNNVYWQIQVSYCAAPQAPQYETMGIYVPGAYMDAQQNADGTYTCTVNASGKAGSYTASTAPIVVPVTTPGYSAAPAPSQYSFDSIADYLNAGFVYVQPGLRGRSNMKGTTQDETYSGGAPWGVADLKAAIRYYRYNAALLPGNTDSIYTFGMSGGGAQSALAGATGDSPLYTPYLNAIGAAMTGADGKAISDAVTGSMCWCPITSLDEADEAYEWNMGQFSASGSRADTGFGSVLSKDLAASYAEYINTLKLKNGGTQLSLSESSDGVYQAGTYYDYILSVAQTSLNHFLSDTSFPYTETQTAQFPGGSNGTMGGSSSGTGSMPAGRGMGGLSSLPSLSGMSSLPAGGSSGTTYNTVQDYIASLNSEAEWVQYDASSNTARITSLADFARYCKQATKALGAFDELDRGQGENNLFGNGQGTSLHFDPVLGALLKKNESAYASFSDWNTSYVSDFETDLARKDELGVSVQTRVDMYNPMYFLCDSYSGCGTSTVAKYWRIRTGAFQPDTALTVEANLALALQNTASVRSVDFETVWGMKHVQAERSGSSTANFISWVQQCAK